MSSANSLGRVGVLTSEIHQNGQCKFYMCVFSNQSSQKRDCERASHTILSPKFSVRNRVLKKTCCPLPRLSSLHVIYKPGRLFSLRFFTFAVKKPTLSPIDSTAQFSHLFSRQKLDATSHNKNRYKSGTYPVGLATDNISFMHSSCSSLLLHRVHTLMGK